MTVLIKLEIHGLIKFMMAVLMPLEYCY